MAEQEGTVSKGFDNTRFYRVMEVAAVLRTSRHTVEQAIDRGDLRAHVINRRGDRRIAGTAANAWLDSVLAPPPEG